MKLMKTSLIAVMFLSTVLLSACTGPEGPMGPAGEDGLDGPGTQTTYIFDITPAASTDFETLSCPAIQADSATSDFSTITCYIRTQSSLGVWDEESLVLPYSDSVTGENYYYTVKEDTVVISWVGLPDLLDFEAIITVVND